MSTKEDKSQGETSCHRVEIMPMSTNNHPESGTKSSKYAQYNKEKAKRVIFWCGCAMLFIGVTSCVTTLSVRSLQQISFGSILLWQWCLLITALLGGPVLSIAISNLIVISINHEPLAKENIVYYVLGLVESAWVVLWFGMILLAWIWVIQEPKYLGVAKQSQLAILHTFAVTDRTVTLTLVTILLGSFLWLVKDLCIMKRYSTFHIRRFFDRIRESLVQEYRINVLMKKKWGQGTPQRSKVFIFTGEKNICLKHKEHKIDLSMLEATHSEELSCWIMDILTQGIIKGRPLGSIDVDIKENTAKKEEITVEGKVNEVAKAIFSNLVHAGGGDTPNKQEDIAKKGEKMVEEKKDNIDAALVHKTIDMDTIENALSSYFEDREEVQEARKWLLEGADAKQVDEEVFRKCVMRAWKRRKALVRTLRVNKILFENLNTFIDVVLVIVIFILWLVMLDVEFRRAMVIAGSAIVGSAFITGEFVRNLLGGFTFIFGVHPFDVGDCCIIEDKPVIIESIDLLKTKVSTLNEEIKIYPNSVLCKLPISNYTRSPPRMADNVVFFLRFDAPEDKIGILKQLIESYIEENSHHWRPEHKLLIELDDSKEAMRVKVTLHVTHTTNHHEYQETLARKSKLTSTVLKFLKDLRLVSSQT